MISDTLHDAIEDIKEYLADFDCYSESRPEIEKVITVMDSLRLEFDLPPGDSRIPILRDALRCLDVGLLESVGTSTSSQGAVEVPEVPEE